MAKFLCLKDALKVVARDRCRHGKLNTSPFNTKQRDAFFFQGDCILNDVKPLFVRRFQGVIISPSTPLSRQLVLSIDRYICAWDWAFSKLFSLPCPLPIWWVPPRPQVQHQKKTKNRKHLRVPSTFSKKLHQSNSNSYGNSLNATQHLTARQQAG